MLTNMYQRTANLGCNVLGESDRIAVDGTSGVGLPSIQIFVFGEHGGGTVSIALFHDVGVDYVSCSVSRLASAQLAAAQTAINNPR